MARNTWSDFGPDVELIREQMRIQPPDDGSVFVEDDGERVTSVAWTHQGQRCSVSTTLVTDLDA